MFSGMRYRSPADDGESELSASQPRPPEPWLLQPQPLSSTVVSRWVDEV